MTLPFAQAEGTIFGVALNYQRLLTEHLDTFQKSPYLAPPTSPVLFIKPPNTHNSNNGTVVFPQGARLQPGPTVAVIMAKNARRVKAAQAYEYIAGLTIANEFSLPESDYYRPAIKEKCRDGFCAILDTITPLEHLPNIDSLTLSLMVNHKVCQTNTTANLIRSIPELIEEISAYMTLYAGDLLLTGVPEGRVDVAIGDMVTVEVTGLGQLTNTIIAPKGEIP